MKTQNEKAQGLAESGRGVTDFEIYDDEDIIYDPVGEGDFPPHDQEAEDAACGGFVVEDGGDEMGEAILKLFNPAEGRDAASQILKIGQHRVKIAESSISLIETRRNQATGETYDAAVPLSDFSARIEKQVAIHRVGANAPELNYEIGGRNQNGELPPLRVPAVKFGSLEWVAAGWGVSALRHTTGKTHDKLLGYAIERANPSPDRVAVYEELGWRRISNEWAYLHAGGGIGPKGRFACAVEPGPRLAHAILPEPDPSVDVVRLLLGLEATAPEEISWPLIAAAFRAPLVRWEEQVDSVFLLGRSGSRKTALATVFQQFFGADFGGGRSGAKPPASFCDTPKSILHRAHAAGGMLFLADDFAPATSERAAAQQRAGAEELFRSSANRSPRGRLSANSTPLADYFPRGLLLVTGEDFPFTESIAARMFLLEINRASVRLDALTKAQRAAKDGVLASVMGEYIEWLARRGEPVGSPDRVEVGGAPRAAEMLANLVWGAENLFAWMIERGCDKVDVAVLRERCMEALLRSGKASARNTAAVNPADHFIELLQQAILMRRARLAVVGVVLEEEDSTPVIGYLDAKKSTVWILPAPALSVAKRLATESGKPHTICDTGMGSRLAEANRLLSRDETRGTTTIRKTLGGSNVPVWELAAEGFVTEGRETPSPEPNDEIPF